MQIFLKNYGLILLQCSALTILTLSVSMSLSSTATNRLASLREVSWFTNFVLTNKAASIALRLNCLLRSCFIKSNRKSPIRRLGIRALSCDQQVHTTDQGPLLRYDLPCFNLQKICISTHRTKYSLPYLFPFCQGI